MGNRGVLRVILLTLTLILSSEARPQAHLAQDGNATQVEILVRDLSSVNPAIREDAARALGELGDPSAIDPLFTAVGDQFAANRRVAANALQELGEPMGVVVYDALGGSKTAEKQLLKSRDPRVAAAAVNAMSSLDSRVRVRAARILAALGDLVDITRLAENLSNLDYEIRAESTQVLGEIGSEQALPYLREALRDGAPSVREAAGWALTEFEPNGAAEELIEAFPDPIQNVTVALVYAMGKTRDPRVIPYLLEGLGDSNGKIREAAVWALQVYTDPRTISPLLGALRDPDPRVRKAAPFGLADLDDERIDVALVNAAGDGHMQVRKSVATVLEKRGESLGKTIFAVLRGSSKACRQLKLSKDARATAPLISALNSRSVKVRRAAARCLGRLEEPSAVDELQVMATNGYLFDKAAATTALIKIQGPIPGSAGVFFNWLSLPLVRGVLVVLVILSVIGVTWRFFLRRSLGSGRH